MSKGRKVVIYTLLGLNILLLLGLIHTNVVPAQAAAPTYRPTDYTVVVGDISGGEEAVTVIDQAQGKMAVLVYDRQKKRVVVLGRPKELEWSK